MAKTLSDRQMMELKERLQERRAELREKIRQELLRSDDETYGELAGRVHDEGDASVADLLADIRIATVDNLVRESKEIEEALQRMTAGTYGVCEECGGYIEPARLLAHPTAKRCFNCQTQYEKTHAGEQRSSL